MFRRHKFDFGGKVWKIETRAGKNTTNIKIAIRQANRRLVRPFWMPWKILANSTLMGNWTCLGSTEVKHNGGETKRIHLLFMVRRRNNYNRYSTEYQVYYITIRNDGGAEGRFSVRPSLYWTDEERKRNKNNSIHEQGTTTEGTVEGQMETTRNT